MIVFIYVYNIVFGMSWFGIVVVVLIVLFFVLLVVVVLYFWIFELFEEVCVE